jgi:hypothetical protein
MVTCVRVLKGRYARGGSWRKSKGGVTALVATVGSGPNFNPPALAFSAASIGFSSDRRPSLGARSFLTKTVTMRVTERKMAASHVGREAIIVDVEDKK